MFNVSRVADYYQAILEHEIRAEIESTTDDRVLGMAASEWTDFLVAKWQLEPIELDIRYVDHLRGRGCALFDTACANDLEGIVAKWVHGTYQTGQGTSWLKVKNPAYSQMEGRRELFEARVVGGERRRVPHAPPALSLI